jgi:nucleotide-binding universal stress UspA family protein
MYKTIVVHVDASMNQDSRLRAAAQLANGFEAHLVGSTVTGMSWAGYAMLGAPVYPALIDEAFGALRTAAGARLAAFEDCARALGVTSFESRLAEEEAGFALVLQARFADLIVLGQEDAASQASPGDGHGLREQVILDGGRPVLVVPDAWKGQLLAGTAVVGWDGSMPAVRAITGALPMLRRMRSVELVLVNPAGQHRVGDTEPGADMALYLARHGVPIDVVVEYAADGAGEALLARADAEGVTMLVAGAFGHSRYREWMLGGVTRDLLQRARVPVLFAH